MTSRVPAPRRPTREERRALDPLGDFLVWWDDVTSQDADELERVLDEACRNPKAAERERALQRHLEANPLLLIQHMGGGRGRWVIPQKRFGSEFVPDFVIGESYSGGWRWTLVELESPASLMFIKKGDPSAGLQHALRQLTDWRAWLTRNQDYAARARKDQGLGLTDISPNSSGLILIGRERDLDPSDNPRRQRLEEDNRIMLHTYDWLVRQARGRVRALERSKAPREDD